MPDKSQAIHEFWSGFDLPAYDENTVPDNAVKPYITYSVSEDSLGNMVLLNASLWYKSTSWAAITKKANEIANKVGGFGFFSQRIDGGFLWLTKGSPFAQRMGDDSDDTIRRILINIKAEFLTAF